MKFDAQPPKEYKTTMDYKAGQIKKFADEKQEGMRLMSSGRDAVLMVTALIPTGYLNNTTEDEVKAKILEWRKWFYTEIYGQSDDFYKSNNKPF